MAFLKVLSLSAQRVVASLNAISPSNGVSVATPFSHNSSQDKSRSSFHTIPYPPTSTVTSENRCESFNSSNIGICLNNGFMSKGIQTDKVYPINLYV